MDFKISSYMLLTKDILQYKAERKKKIKEWKHTISCILTYVFTHETMTTINHPQKFSSAPL